MSNSSSENTKHAFVHVARPLIEVEDIHVGFVVDNRAEEPILLIEEVDFENKHLARQTLQNFFGGEGVTVRIRSIHRASPGVLSHVNDNL